MLNANEVKLTDDTLANIHLMAPLLTDEGRDKALVYMRGLLDGAKQARPKPRDDTDKS